MGPEALAQVLQPLSGQTHPKLIVGLLTSDDAAVYRFSNDLALIQTIDYFTPIVDDPETYGAIAAANSMSDVYAMGGQVLFGLNVAAFPDTVSADVIAEIFAGGATKMKEAGGAIAGGHTVTAPEPLYGLSVTGSVRPDSIWSKAGAMPGDHLVLSKPIGTGLVATAAMNDAAASADLAAAIDSMLALNKSMTEIGQRFDVHACTDITGFGLAGHAWEMAAKGNVQFRVRSSSVPVLPGAQNYASANQIAGGLTRNQHYFSTRGVAISKDIEPALATALFDPQTSGGLLVAVPEAQVEALLTACQQAGQPAWDIGQVESGSGVLFAK